MKIIVPALLALLSACAAPPPSPPPLPAPPPAVATPAPLPHPVAQIARQYHATAEKEAKAINAPNVTADYIRAIQAADTGARHALRSLARHPTKRNLEAARIAVRQLAAVLDNGP